MKALVSIAAIGFAVPVFAQTASPTKQATPPSAVKPATAPTAAAAGSSACKAAVVPEHVMVAAKDLKWVDGPPGLPAGAKMAVLQGDPSQANQVFTIRAKFPANFKIPAHWHSSDELVTVISGTLMMGHGEKSDWKTVAAAPAGSFLAMPAKSGHYVMAKGETVVQIHAIGPFDITYYDAKDDPRTGAAGAKAGQP